MNQMQTTYMFEDDCNAKTSPACDGPTTCVSGIYHADKDQQCLEAMQAVTCGRRSIDVAISARSNERRRLL